VVGASPGTVVSELIGGTQLPANQTFPAGSWAATLTMVGVALAVVGAGAITFARRDG
jgi:hypothetical protein